MRFKGNQSKSPIKVSNQIFEDNPRITSPIKHPSKRMVINSLQHKEKKMSDKS